VTHVFGYVASAVLFATLVTQIHKQWQRGTTRGVSRWLFIGQLVASIGFTIESAVIGSTLFVIVNSVLALSAVVGMGLWFYQRRRERGGAEDEGPLEGALTTEVRA
jgi:MtN3 and saliva related transmembrane protein